MIFRPFMHHCVASSNPAASNSHFTYACHFFEADISRFARHRWRRWRWRRRLRRRRRPGRFQTHKYHVKLSWALFIFTCVLPFRFAVPDPLPIPKGNPDLCRHVSECVVFFLFLSLIQFFGVAAIVRCSEARSRGIFGSTNLKTFYGITEVLGRVWLYGAVG